MIEILNGKAVMSEEVTVGNKAYYYICEKATLEISMKVVIRQHLSMYTIGVFKVKHFNSTTY